MTQKEMELKIYLILLMAIITATLLAKQVSERQYVLQRGCNCMERDIIFTTERSTEISCAVLCKNSKCCEGFKYDDNNNSCIGCRSRIKGNVNDVEGDYQCWNELPPSPCDCLGVQRQDEAATDGVYPVTTSMGTQVDVDCVMSKQGGGWTAMLKRFDGSVKFDRVFKEYETGFGNKDGDHWLGLKYIHEMTADTESDLHIMTFGGVGVKLFPDREVFEEWSNFSVGSGPLYALQIGSLTNWTYAELTAVANMLNNSRGLGFSTKDVDRDGTYGVNHSCSQHHGGGGWWYNNCKSVNPTGLYLPIGTESYTSMHNNNFMGDRVMQRMTVMFRRKPCI